MLPCCCLFSGLDGAACSFATLAYDRFGWVVLYRSRASRKDTRSINLMDMISFSLRRAGHLGSKAQCGVCCSPQFTHFHVSALQLSLVWSVAAQVPQVGRFRQWSVV